MCPDVGRAEENMKVHLVSSLNQNIHLDAYSTMHSGDSMAHLETVQDRLPCSICLDAGMFEVG